MRKLIGMILVISLLFTGSFTGVASADGVDEFSYSASDFVQQIGAGWNLGNTFESYQEGVEPLKQETAWWNPITQKDMIAKVASTGFNAIRIPVSWGPQTSYSNGVYTVNSTFLNRVKEVVDWCYEYDMYVIVNMHHDDGYWLNISASDTEWEIVKEQYKQTWEQVASAFAEYDSHLILEGANEITATKIYDGCGTNGDKCWWGHSQKTFNRQNELYQIFVDTVRSTGGNNSRRYLMLPTYGAQWYANQVNKLVIPNNDEHIIVDIHWYSYADQMVERTRRGYADTWIDYATVHNVGIVIGECGFNESKDDAYKASWANAFVADLRQNYKIPVFLWDDGGNMKILNRKTTPYDWTDNSQQYVAAVVGQSKPFITVPSNDPVLGDVNSDGRFALSDVRFLREYLSKDPSGKIKRLPKEADVNFDGSYNMKDYAIMMHAIVNNIDIAGVVL